MTTQQTPIDYDMVNPHDDVHLVDALRARLDVPNGWVSVLNTGGGCVAVQTVIDAGFEEDGTPEDGPHLSWWPTRYALLTCDGPNAWILGFYDDALSGDEGGDTGACVQLVGRMDTFEQVADAVAAVLVRATTLNAKPPILNGTATEQELVREVAAEIEKMNDPSTWGKPDERDYVRAACRALHIDPEAMEDVVDGIADEIWYDAGETYVDAEGIAAYAVKQLTLAYIVDNAGSR